MAERKDPLDGCVGFEWDEGNEAKNWGRPRVMPEEAEELFFNEPLVVRRDLRHSMREKRYYALGQTDAAYTIRGSRVRVISVRDMSRKEREVYAGYEEEADT